MRNDAFRLKSNGGPECACVKISTTNHTRQIVGNSHGLERYDPSKSAFPTRRATSATPRAKSTLMIVRIIGHAFHGVVRDTMVRRVMIARHTPEAM